MAVSSSAVKAGKAYVEVGANITALEKGMKAAQKSVAQFGESVAAAGKKMVALGAAIAAPLALGVKSFATYEDALAQISANAKIFGDDLKAVEVGIARISQTTGAGPTAVANAMGELLKAGLSVKEAMAGATEAAVKFAKVAALDVPTAANVMKDAMNVFGVDATTAIDTMSRAADASSISLQEVVQSFQNVASVAEGAGASIQDTATAIAILGNAGTKGAEAGTGLKTVLLRLRAPADECATAMKDLKINVRDAQGSMLPLSGIIGEINNKISGLNDTAKDKALRDLFGSYGITAGGQLLKVGAKGFEDFAKQMSKALSVAEKYEIFMGTLSGAAQRAMAGLESLGIVIGATLAPAISEAAKVFTGLLGGLAEIADHNKGLIKTFAAVAVGVAAFGVALIGASIAIKAVSSVLIILNAGLAVFQAAMGAFAALSGIFAAMTSPLGIVILSIITLGVVIDTASTAVQDFGAIVSSIVADAGNTFNEMKSTALLAFKGIAEALKSGDIEKAGKILWAALKVEWLEGTNFIKKVASDWGTATMEVFRNVSTNMSSGIVDAWAAIDTAFIGGAGIILKSLNTIQGAFKDFLKAVAPAGSVLWEQLFGTAGDATEKIDEAVAKATADIELKRQQSQKTIAGGAGAEDEKKRKAAIEALEKDKADLEKAKAELAALMAPAPAAPKGEGGAAGALGDIQAELGKAPGEKAGTGTGAADKDKDKLEDIGKGVEAAARKVDVKGTFSAIGAGQSLAAGDTASSKLEEIKKKHDPQIEVLKKLYEKAKEGKLVFVS